ncbi:MAG TPA: hypothetical protein DCL00_04540 [Opitutae bacterium]|nr:hypothetical protein [Opitutae bacterium]
MAGRIAQNIPADATQREKLDILISQMFEKYGFHGSSLDFHHRANSYVNEVIDEREGLPITLSLLFLELGNRIDLPLFGLSTPGHFLALYREPGQGIDQAVLIDAFGGQTISRQQANELTNSELSEKDFVPASDTEIITRILGNLLRSAEWQRDSTAALRYLNALVAINPQDQYFRTLRAMTFYGEGMLAEALSDINLLIEQDPQNAANDTLLEIKRRLSDPH